MVHLRPFVDSRPMPARSERSAAERAPLLRDLLIASHRGPVQWQRVDGMLRAQRNDGGLVTALSDLMRFAPGARWLSAPNSDCDRNLARTHSWRRVDLGAGPCSVQMLDLEPSAHRDFYGVVANPLLWFTQHGLYDGDRRPHVGAREQRAWTRGYVAVNRAFAEAIADDDVSRTGALVMVHDYHCYLVPGMVRARRPDLFVHFFLHIPWPEAHTWSALPSTWTKQIVRGLLGSDIVGMQTAGDVQRFLETCRTLLGADFDTRNSSVRYGEREIAVRHYPISVDEESLLAVARSEPSRAAARRLAANRSEQVILRVDRTDPSKNIVRGFQAFARLLEQHPELCGRVRFRALLQPSRQDVPEYAGYMRDIERVVAGINHIFGTADWCPIELHLGEDLALAVAAYRDYDVLFVNSVVDGMNLVSKEAPMVNRHHGVLTLSKSAGSYEELGPVAVTLDPLDVDQQARALYAALVMPVSERRMLHRATMDIVRRNDLRKWLRRQLDDIELLRARAAA